MSTTRPARSYLRTLNTKLAALREEQDEVLASDRSAWVKEAMLRSIAASERAVSAELARAEA